MFIYFVRHGETAGNQQKFHQYAETPLAPEGEMQAVKVAERLKAIAFNEIWVSPLRRARQTAEAINEYQHLTLKEVSLLHEIKRPTSIEGKRYDDPTVQTVYAKLWEHQEDLDFVYEDGESFTQVVERMRAMKKKLEKHAQGKPAEYTLGVVSHGTVLTLLLLHILLDKNATPTILRDSLLRTKINNTGISVARVEQGDWKFLTFNDYAHL